jgi:hypothetical protein
MGLNVLVGVLSSEQKDDPEIWHSHFGKLNLYLAGLAGLHGQTIKQHVEPTSCPSADFDMYGYQGLHYLRRIAAHVEIYGELPQPGPREASKLADCDSSALKNYELAFEDGLKKRKPLQSLVLKLRPTQKKRDFDHLMIHSDCDGFYIPQDFDAVLISEPTHGVPGVYVGSSHKLKDECKRLLTLLDAPLSLEDSDTFEEALEFQGLLEDEALQGGAKVPKWKRYAIESLTAAQLYQAAELSVKTGAAVVFA